MKNNLNGDQIYIFLKSLYSQGPTRISLLEMDSKVILKDQ